MSENKARQVNKTVVGQEVISKKGAVMKVTRLRLSAKGSEMLRSNSRGIRGKKDEHVPSDEQDAAYA